MAFYCPRWHPVIKYTKPECKGRKDKYIVMIMQTCYNMTFELVRKPPSIKKLGKVHNMYDYFCLWGFCKQKSIFFAFLNCSVFVRSRQW